MLTAIATATAVAAIACDDPDSSLPHDDPEGAIQECTEGLESVRALPLAERSAMLGRACADLYAEPGCRRAMRDSGDVPPERRAATLAQTCRDAYCPKLEEPRPALCTTDIAELRASELPALWSELSHAALSRDMGAQRAEQVRDVFAVSAVAMDPPSESEGAPEDDPAAEPRAESEPALQITVRQDDEGKLHLDVDHPDGESSTHALSDSDPQAVADAVPSAERLGPGTGVIVTPAPGVPYEQVVTVMDGMKAAGYTRLSLGGPPRGESP